MSKSKERVDEAFGLIGKGNEQEEREEYWEAASCFGDAMRVLFQLAVSMEPETEEEHKIEELYQTQCREYLHRARSAFVQALTREDDMDKAKGQDDDPKFITLTNEEAKQRVQLFSTLFSKELELEVEDLVLPDPKAIQEHQSSLENRLRSLNASIPAILKTEEERMKDIDRGLKGLGLNLYSHSDNKSKGMGLDFPPVSKEQQMADIIAQAKDEANYDAMYGTKKATMDDDDNSVTLTEEGSLLDDDDDDDDVDDVDNDVDSFIPKLRNKKAIRTYAVNAQVKLAQLIALLDNTKGEGADVTSTTKSTSKQGTKESNDDDDDDAVDDEGSRTPAEKVEFDLEQGKILLLKARKNLSKAVETWEIER